MTTPRGRLTASAAAALIAIALTACGSSTSDHSHQPQLDVHEAERTVANEILQNTHAPAFVVCPKKIPKSNGYSFTCTANLEVGTVTARVTETGNAGHLRYATTHPFVLLNVAKVERAIRESIALQKHLDAAVTCPVYVLQQKGLAFTCNATVKGRPNKYPFSVREVNEKGEVRFGAR